MSSSTVPLTVISNANNNFYFAQMAIGQNVLTQSLPKGGGYYWFVVINRSTLAVEYNAVQTQNDIVPAIGNLNTTDHLLAVATLGLGLNIPPQGALFQFLDLNGGGSQLRRVEQVAQQFNCGTWGTFAYALVGILGNQNTPGFEDCAFGNGANGPFLTVQLLPSTVGGKTVYTPVQISNA